MSRDFHKQRCANEAPRAGYEYRGIIKAQRDDPSTYLLIPDVDGKNPSNGGSACSLDAYVTISARFLIAHAT